MNNSTETYSLNLNNLNLLHGDYMKSDYWIEKIYEDGGFHTENQYMVFNSNGIEVVVDFDMTVSGTVQYDPGDYWTPPYSDTEVTDLIVNVTALHVDEWEVDLTEEMKNFLEVEIKKHL